MFHVGKLYLIDTYITFHLLIKMIILGSCNTRALFVLFTEETIASNREVISFLVPSSTMHYGSQSAFWFLLKLNLLSKTRYKRKPALLASYKEHPVATNEVSNSVCSNRKILIL